MSASAGSPGKPHTTAWTVVILIGLILYVVTWPVIEIKIRWREFWKPAVLTLPKIQKPPEWVRLAYVPLHSLRKSLGQQNVLARYWSWWNERLVMRPLRERSQAHHQRMKEILRKSEELLKRTHEMRRKDEEGMPE